MLTCIPGREGNRGLPRNSRDMLYYTRCVCVSCSVAGIVVVLAIDATRYVAGTRSNTVRIGREEVAQYEQNAHFLEKATLRKFGLSRKRLSGGFYTKSYIIAYARGCWKVAPQ